MKDRRAARFLRSVALAAVLLAFLGATCAQAKEIPSSAEKRAAVPKSTAPTERAPGGETAVAPWDTTLRVPGSVLRPRQNDVSYSSDAEGGALYATSGNASTVFNTPVYLPQGATVEWVRLYYYDNDPADGSYGWFTVYDLYGALVTEWAVQSVDGGYGYRDVLVDPPHTIDYNSYSYVLNWRPNVLGVNMQLCGFRLYYTAPPATAAKSVVIPLE